MSKDTSLEEQIANARMMAQAPRLADVLRKVADRLALHAPSGNGDLLDLAEDALFLAGHTQSTSDLAHGINALLGLIQLVCSRSDMPPDIKRALESSHRVIEAREALAKAGL